MGVMLAWEILILTLRGLDGSGSTGPGFMVDLLDVQWWQGIIGIIVLLGLSPAPWILGLAVGRIQFTKASDAAHARELAAREKGWSEEKAALENYHVALTAERQQRYSDLQVAHEQQRVRADTMTTALAESTAVITSVGHIMHEITNAAKGVSPDG